MAAKQNLTGNHPPAEEKTIFLPNTWTPSWGLDKQVHHHSFLLKIFYKTMRGNIKRFRLEKCSTSNFFLIGCICTSPSPVIFCYDVDRDVYIGWILGRAPKFINEQVSNHSEYVMDEQVTIMCAELDEQVNLYVIWTRSKKGLLITSSSFFSCTRRTKLEQWAT